MNDIPDALRSIGLRAPPEMLSSLLCHATKSQWPIPTFCEQLVALEKRERDHAGLERRTKAASLGCFLPLDRFDWNHPRRIERDLYEELLDVQFVQKAHNVLLRGPAGVGKTTLAQNLGLLALQRGMTVRFCTLATAITDLLRQPSLPATERRLRLYTAPDLLILDELGYVPTDGHAADLLFHIVSHRHEKRPIVITTNLSFKQWGQAFPGATCLGALIDRFAQHCHVIDIDADSYRQKHRLVRPTRPAIKKSSLSTVVLTPSNSVD